MSLYYFNDNINSINKYEYDLNDIINTPGLRNKNSPCSNFSFKAFLKDSNSNENNYNKENVNISNVSEFSTDPTIKKNYDIQNYYDEKNYSGKFVLNKNSNNKLKINSFLDDNLMKDNDDNYDSKIPLSFSDFCIGIQINNNYENDKLMDIENDDNNIIINYNKNILFENESYNKKKFLSIKRYNNYFYEKKKDIDDLTKGFNNFSFRKKKNNNNNMKKFVCQNMENESNENIHNPNIDISFSTTFSIKKQYNKKYYRDIKNKNSIGIKRKKDNINILKRTIIFQ
jgi:hypothetical protein